MEAAAPSSSRYFASNDMVGCTRSPHRQSRARWKGRACCRPCRARSTGRTRPTTMHSTIFPETVQERDAHPGWPLPAICQPVTALKGANPFVNACCDDTPLRRDEKPRSGRSGCRLPLGSLATGQSRMLQPGSVLVIWLAGGRWGGMPGVPLRPARRVAGVEPTSIHGTGR